jgi:hypothetical protein
VRPMLFLFTQKGCPACAAALPEFDRYRLRNPMQMAITVDADGPYAHFVGKIRSTPLYVLRWNQEEKGVTHEGTMKAEAIEKWVSGAVKSIGESR